MNHQWWLVPPRRALPIGEVVLEGRLRPILYRTARPVTRGRARANAARRCW